MAVIQDPNVGTDIAKVESHLKGLRTVVVPRGPGYSISAITGLMAAALGANSSVFAMRVDPSAGGSFQALIERIRMRFTTTTAFTTPITAGRRLAIFRGSGAAASGGTTLATIAKKRSTDPNSQVAAGEGGDARIATTAGLTATGVTFESDPFRTMALTHVGAAGASSEEIFEFDAAGGARLVLEAGQLLAIRNPVAMDAGGVWQLDVDVDWMEIS